MKYLNLALTTIALLISSSANAALITWDYEGTLSAFVGTDTLGINNETISLHLEFDDTDTWVLDGTSLYFPTTSSSVSITGGHTIATKSATPAIIYLSGGQAGISESIGNNSFVDFIIDGTTTLTGSVIIGTPIVPLEGENLLLGHLPDSLGTIDQLLNSGDIYSYTNETITMTGPPPAVPVPAAVWLFGSGLIGLIGIVKRKKA